MLNSIFSKETLQYLWGPALVALIAVIPNLIKTFKESRGKKDAKKFGDNIKRISEIHTIIKGLGVSIASVNRVLILESHNGGGIPGPRNPSVYISALYEEKLDSIGHILDTVVKMKADRFQRDRILTPLAYHGNVELKASAAEGLTKDLYMAYDHEWSVSYRLRADERSMTYVTVFFSEGDMESLTHLERETLRVYVSRLTTLFSD